MDDTKYQIDLLTALNERLMNSEKMYRHIAECTGDLFMYFDYKTTPVKVDLIGPWDDMTGLKLLNRPYDESYMLNLINEDDQDLFRTKILEIERDGETSSSCEIRVGSKNLFFKADAYVEYSRDKVALEKIVKLKDITKDKMNYDELLYLAYYDSLTGIHNRNFFVRNLRDMCEKAENLKASVEVMFIDIDDFKKINDSIGLLFGDELVQEFGQFLKGFESEDIEVGRFGSDVFVISVYDPCGQRSADVINRKILERLRHPFILSNKTEVKFTVTCGVAEYPDAGRTALEVIKNAEIVLYKAKDKSNTQIQYFESDILDKFIKNVSIEKQLKEAVDNEDFILFYQPLIYAETGKLRGAEALIRWPDNEGGFITSPAEFIPIAEKNGAIIPIGDWVIKESVKLLNEWRMKYHVPLILCINISAVQLEKDNFVEQIQHYIQMYDINPEMLELEITESVLINDYENVIDKIKTLRGIGIKISLDDFGTGYSSLSYLKDLPIDTIKLDKSFIDCALTDDSCRAIIESIIEMSKKLGYEIVAEGVESKEQFNFLRKSKCDIIQGYIISKPVSRMDFEKILIRHMP